MCQPIEIKVPDKYPLTDSLVEEIQLMNLDLKIGKTNGNTLIVDELAYQFYDYGFVELKFPTSIFPDSDFNELYEINEDELNFEQPGNHSIILKMGNFDPISILTALITSSIVVWAAIKKIGRVRNENGECFLAKAKEVYKGTGIYIADVSYISYDKVPREIQKTWKKHALEAPTLCIEIVSSKYGLKPTLRKMEDVWMRFGTDVGLVICPFSKKLFIFEKDKLEYVEQDILEPFTHPLLPGYVGEYGKYLDEIE
jgi:Uma2 family endonuclease